MFGHLKAEDFTNLLEGTPLPDKARVHLESCARCTQTFKAIEDIRSQVTAMQVSADEHIPEPDWADFRGDVRNALLSRAVKRDSSNRNWLGGMNWKPAAAWGFSVVLVFGLITSVVWRNQNSMEPSFPAVAPAAEITDTAALDAMASMAQDDVFDDLLQLNESETENLRQLVENLTQKGVKPQ